jgi:hypothetical protein
MDSKKVEFEVPKLERLGTVAEMTKTNNLVQLSDVPIGSPLQAGS